VAKQRIKANRGYKTREKLYDAAIALFEEQGYDATTIEDITERAGTAKGTFYVHFDSKRDLVYHTIDRYDEIAKETYETVSKYPTFKEQLVQYMKLSNSHVKGIGWQTLKALYMNDLIDEELVVTRPTIEIYYSLNRIIEFGISTGELSKDHPVEYYRQMIVFGILGIDFWWCSGASRNADISSFAEELAKVLCEGLTRI